MSASLITFGQIVDDAEMRKRTKAAILKKAIYLIEIGTSGSSRKFAEKTYTEHGVNLMVQKYMPHVASNETVSSDYQYAVDTGVLKPGLAPQDSTIEYIVGLLWDGFANQEFPEES